MEGGGSKFTEVCGTCETSRAKHLSRADGLHSMAKSLSVWLLDSPTFPLLSPGERRASFTELEALVVECSLSVGVQSLSTDPGLCESVVEGLCVAVREGVLELADG